MRGGEVGEKNECEAFELMRHVNLVQLTAIPTRSEHLTRPTFKPSAPQVKSPWFYQHQLSAQLTAAQRWRTDKDGGQILSLPKEYFCLSLLQPEGIGVLAAQV